MVFCGGLFGCKETLMMGDGHLSVGIRKDLELSKEFYWSCFYERKKFCENCQSCTKNYRKLIEKNTSPLALEGLALLSQTFCLAKTIRLHY